MTACPTCHGADDLLCQCGRPDATEWAILATISVRFTGETMTEVLPVFTVRAATERGAIAIADDLITIIASFGGQATVDRQVTAIAVV